MNDSDDQLGQVADRILGELETAWNAGDGERFAAGFRPDADFVDVLGRIHRGREAIARAHQQIFDTIYLDSRVRLRQSTIRRLSADIALAHVNSSLEVPAGPRAGDWESTPTMVLNHDDEGWQIAAFHNTFVQTIPGVK